MVNVQGVKDTFYATLRDRVAAGNAARTVVVRGVVRPGVVVGENELPGASVDGISLVEAFCLRWTGLRVDASAPLPLAALTCEIRYATDGSAEGAGLDRGRALAAMDAELAKAICTQPQHVAEITVTEVSGGGAAAEAATGTSLFWSDAAFAPAVMRGERMERTATVEVFGYGQ